MKHDILWADSAQKRTLVTNTGMLPADLVKRSGLLIAAVSESADIEGVLFGEEIETGVFEISYILVDERFRRRGAARAMVGALMGPSPYRPAGVDIITASYTRKEDSALGAFFDAMGFDEDTSPTSIYHYKLGEFYHLSQEPIPGHTGRVISLSDITGRMYRQFLSRLMAKRDESAEDFWMLPDDMDFYNSKLSKLIVDAEGDPYGCILISGGTDENLLDETCDLTIEYLCLLKRSKHSISDVTAMAVAAFRTAEDMYDLDTTITVNAVNPAIPGFLERLTKKKRKPFAVCEFRTFYMQ